MSKPAKTQEPPSRARVIAGMIIASGLVAFFVVSLIDFGIGEPGDYARSWDDTPTAKLSRALVNAGASECGEYKSKARRNSDETLVRCYRGKSALNDYRVMSLSNVVGPLDPDPRFD